MLIQEFQRMSEGELETYFAERVKDAKEILVSVDFDVISIVVDRCLVQVKEGVFLIYFIDPSTESFLLVKNCKAVNAMTDFVRRNH